MKKIITLILICFCLFGCVNKAQFGTKDNPIKMYFVPSVEAGKIIHDGEILSEKLTEMTGYHFSVAVPTSYAAVIEAMGTKEADIGWLATFAYIMAHEKYNAQVGLTTVRYGRDKYRGQFIAKAGSGIEKLEDINGKVIAYTDAASTSGYIYPSALLKMKDVKPENSIMAGSHNASVLAVYSGKADVGCSYWSPAQKGIPQDARHQLAETYPDVYDKVVPFAFTDWIPNDTVTFRDGFPEDMQMKIMEALIAYADSKEGREVLSSLYSIDGFTKAKDSDYNIVRTTLKTLGMNPEQMFK